MKSAAGAAGRSMPVPTRKRARLLAVFLLGAAITLALFSKAFRFGHDCQRTVGQSRHGQAAVALVGEPAAQDIRTKLS